MNYIYSQDIATMGICSSQGQPRSTIVMFVTIQQYGYVHHKRIHLSLCDNMVMFITFYVRHKRISLSHCDNMVMFTKLRWWGDVCHNVRIGYLHHIATTEICSYHCNDRIMFVTYL